MRVYLAFAAIEATQHRSGEYADIVADDIEDGWLLLHSDASFTLPVTSSHMRMLLWKSASPSDGESFFDALQTKSDGLSDKIHNLISVDVRRSGIGMMYSGKFDLLEEVLIAYARRNSRIGYCQGMNYIAAQFIIMGFSPADAYHGLAFLVERVAADYHTPGFYGFEADVRYVRTLLGELYPKLFSTIAEMSANGDNIVQMVMVDTSLSLFARSLPAHALLPVWDILFVHGHRGLVSATAALIVSQAECFDMHPDGEEVIRSVQCYNKGILSFPDSQVNHLLEDINFLMQAYQVLDTNSTAK